MNRNLVSIILLLLVLFVVGCSNKPNISSEEIVESNLHKYLTALESKDIEVMVSLTEDIRFSDKRVQFQQYQKINTIIKDTSIKEIKNISETEYLGIVNINEDGINKVLSFPIIKNSEDDWMIIVGQDL